MQAIKHLSNRAIAGSLMLLCVAGTYATEPDSLRLEHMQEIVVSGVQAQEDAPYAVANIKKADLQAFSRTARELPFLFSQTPGVMAWSDNGVGVGTTYLRIRGAGDSRINITLDGIPLNSPEDQCVYWANMSNYASLLGSVQIQRGVGASSNGDGAFGGTVALSTAAPSYVPTAQITSSFGSFGTGRLGGSFSTGLLWDKLIFDGAYHHTKTDGFMHGTSGNAGSFLGSITWLASDQLTIRYKNLGNYEHMGQAWNGATAGNDDSSIMDGMYVGNTGIKTYSDMYDHGLGRYNSLYEQIVYDADNWIFPQDANGNYQTRRYQMADGSYWDKTTDNFWQDHNILTAVWDIDEHWTATASLHYTYGYGYYKEFRPMNKLDKKFGVNGFHYPDANGKDQGTDVVRKKGYEQNTYGIVANLNYKDDRWDIVGGLSKQTFESDHFGYLTYIKDPVASAAVLHNGEYKYYASDATKNDASMFLKAAFNLTQAWQVFADVQFRHVGYMTNGLHDRFVELADGTYTNYRLDIFKTYDFLNPKAGISWSRGGHHAYASAAISHREPERNNFTDNGSKPAPRAERLLDIEAGYNYDSRTWRMGANLYYMDYTDQFVQTGQKSDIGENLTTNIKDSYRCGVEFTAGWAPTRWLTLEGNAALSLNRIKDFDEVVEDWRDKYADDPTMNATAMAQWHVDGNGDRLRTIHYDNSTLAFSPSAILNGFATFHFGGLQATWHTGYVSRQYLDNTDSEDRSLPAFSLTDLSLSYTLPCHRFAGLKECVFGVNVNNLFNQRVAAYGWAYSAIDEKDGFTPDHRYYQIGFTPMAGTTVMGNITLKF